MNVRQKTVQLALTGYTLIQIPNLLCFSYGQLWQRVWWGRWISRI